MFKRDTNVTPNVTVGRAVTVRLSGVDVGFVACYPYADPATPGRVVLELMQVATMPTLPGGEAVHLLELGERDGRPIAKVSVSSELVDVLVIQEAARAETPTA